MGKKKKERSIRALSLFLFFLPRQNAKGSGRSVVTHLPPRLLLPCRVPHCSPSSSPICESHSPLERVFSSYAKIRIFNFITCDLVLRSYGRRMVSLRSSYDRGGRIMEPNGMGRRTSKQTLITSVIGVLGRSRAALVGYLPLLRHVTPFMIIISLSLMVACERLFIYREIAVRGGLIGSVKCLMKYERKNPVNVIRIRLKLARSD